MLPEKVTLWRGTSGLFRRDAARGWSSTTRRSTAAWFARQHSEKALLVGGNRSDRDISKQGDGPTRQALYVAASVLLTRTSNWSPLEAQAPEQRETRRHAPGLSALPTLLRGTG